MTERAIKIAGHAIAAFMVLYVVATWWTPTLFLGWWPVFAYIIISNGLLFYSGFIHQRRLRQEDRFQRGLCLDCGYDLRGGHARCPECGRALIP